MTIAETKAAPHWEKLGVWQHHGIALPLFSLHTKASCGIGEYTDLLPLIDWAKEHELDIIQLLPLNDTGLDTSPYNSISAYALNPIHLGIEQLADIDKVPDVANKIAELKKLNETERVSYRPVREKKEALLNDYFSAIFPSISQTIEFKEFEKDQHSWLKPFALFKSIKESQAWTSWEKWPLRLKSPSRSAYEKLLQEFKARIDYHVFVQYLCFQQMKAVKEKATAQKVFIKGDIPILLSRDSSDVWYNRHLFLFHIGAGAPPDMYSREGQSWGFPVYDWQAFDKENYHWWKERLKVCTSLYHLYRLDHVVGFYRIWTIPIGRKAKEGVFMPENQNEWTRQGEKLMELMLDSSPMLPIAEDLGTVPTSVRQSLQKLGIPGTKMMRWERRWDDDGSYIPFDEYEPISMTTVSTHDSDTVKLWWRHFPKEAKLYSELKGWEYKPFLTFEHMEEILFDSHHSGSLLHINQLMEYLSLFPELVSSDPHAERINIPGKMLATNWTYRFRPSLEEISAHSGLNKAFKHILR